MNESEEEEKGGRIIEKPADEGFDLRQQTTRFLVSAKQGAEIDREGIEIGEAHKKHVDQITSEELDKGLVPVLETVWCIFRGFSNPFPSRAAPSQERV